MVLRQNWRKEVILMQDKYIIVTNNPLVLEKYNESRKVVFEETSYEGILKVIRDKIHEGYILLTHPLSGSVKPNETPYKSVLISGEKRRLDSDSLMLIESAIQACQKFQMKADKYAAHVYSDFQIIDLGLLESAMMSADTL